MIYEIPLRPQPQLASVLFPNGSIYQLRLLYQFNDDNWIMDILDVLDEPIICGIPLVTGADLLAQYEYLGLGCALYCTTDGDQFAPPLWWNLGSTAHLWLEV